MNINIKELCKQIKKSRYFIWTIQEGIHYLSNRQWAIKYDVLPREVLIQLFSIFVEIPEEGKSLIYQAGWLIEKKDAVNLSKVFENAQKGADSGQVTPYVKLYDPTQLRIINFGKYVAYANNEYIKIISDIVESKPVGNGVHGPVSFNENMFIVLPMRLSNNPDDRDILQDLLAS